MTYKFYKNAQQYLIESLFVYLNYLAPKLELPYQDLRFKVKDIFTETAFIDVRFEKDGLSYFLNIECSLFNETEEETVAELKLAIEKELKQNN